MANYYEIDFIKIDASKSGDAITIRYEQNGITRIHVVDGGYQKTGQSIVEHVNKYYGSPTKIDSIVISHNDNDHTGGIKEVIESFDVSEIWMLRPWLYANELLPFFKRFSNVNNLINALKDAYSNIADLESLAEEKKIPIKEPFQGARIGLFTVMAPKKERYLKLVLDSDKTPDAKNVDGNISFSESVMSIVASVVEMVKMAWGEESFPEDGTSNENEMCVVQFASLNGKRILLTADAGREALKETIDYAPVIGLNLPGIDVIQVPHHGSRRNINSELLDSILGPKLIQNSEDSVYKYTAVVSAAKEDKHHPRKSVVRAFYHRGAKVLSNEHSLICCGHQYPERSGWVPATHLQYPDEQEE